MAAAVEGLQERRESGGKVAIQRRPPDAEALGDVAGGMAIQADGKLVVTGSTNKSAGEDTETDVALVRYTPNGTLDQSFDGDGRVITPLRHGDENRISRGVTEAIVDGLEVVEGDLEHALAPVGQRPR